MTLHCDTMPCSQCPLVNYPGLCEELRESIHIIEVVHKTHDNLRKHYKSKI